MRLVIDTNKIISAIIKEGFSREILVNTRFDFLTPAYTLSEIIKYKNEIIKKSGLNENEFSNLLDYIFKFVRVINPQMYNGYLRSAEKIIGRIHISDVPFIAAALAFNCPVWSDDKHFKQQNEVKVYTTKEIANLF